MAMTKEEKAEYMRKYYAANKEMLKAHSVKIYSENKEVHKEVYKARSAKYRAENPEKEKIRCAKHRVENPEKIKGYNAKGVAELKDYYITRQLRAQGFKNEQITPELIELKRITLKTTRLCRQLNT